MPEFTVQSLLTTPCVAVQDVGCSGGHRHSDAEEHASATHLVFPYRGAFVRHLGRDEAVAEANQVLFFNAFEGYRVSHPVPGGDASLDLVVDEATLRELVPSDLLKDGADLEFRVQRLRIDPRAQALVALLRHGLHAGIAEPLEAESVALTLVRRGLRRRGTRSLQTPAALPRAAWPTHRSRNARIHSESGVTTEKACAACDCKLDANSIKLKIGGKTAEVCCEDCARKLTAAQRFTPAPR